MSKAWPFLFVVALAGCGGDSGSAIFLDGNDGTVSLAFSNASSYNGTSSPLTSFTALSGSANNISTSISVTNGTRQFAVFFASSGLAVGSSVSLGGTTGSTVAYADAAGQWSGTSGTVTLVSRTSAGLSLQLTNVVLEGSSGGATGSVTVSGTVSFVSI